MWKNVVFYDYTNFDSNSNSNTKHGHFHGHKKLPTTMIFQVYDCQEIKTCKTVQMISMCQGAQVKAKAAEAARAPNPAATASHLLVQRGSPSH